MTAAEKWGIAMVLAVVMAATEAADGIVTLKRPLPTEDFTHTAAVDEFDRFHLYWKFDDTTITFEIHAKTLGWVGLGFSPNGGMLGSDIFMAWVKDGKAFGQDRYAEVDKSQPLIDQHQDWKLLMGKEELGYTVIKVTRKRNTCDKQDFIITDDTARMIYAWNDQDPSDENSPSYHGAQQRGSKSMYLIEYGVLNAPSGGSETTYTWDLRVGNLTLPDDDTVYWCKLFEVPPEAKTKKIHVTRVDGLIDKNNTGVVHHVVLYLCSAKNLTGMTYNDRCRQKNMPVDLRYCINVMFGWAVGMLDYRYPENVGFPLGAENEHFLMLEMHYDNPTRKAGIEDNSGLRLHYTYDYRQFEAATAFIGEIIYYPPMIIPPNAKNFTIESYCSTDCTKNVIPPTGIHVISSFLHTHLLGRKVLTRHIRNGKELPEIARDDHYDFNFQQNRIPKKPVVILPGDELITTCVYDSTSRKNVTYSGEGTNEEMCLNFLSYYPKSKFKKCLSLTQDVTPVYNYVMEKAMTGQIHIDPDDYKRNNRTFYHYLNDINWTEEEVAKFQKLTLGSHRYREYCDYGDEDEDQQKRAFGGSMKAHRYRLVIDEPYVKQDVCDDGKSLATTMSLLKVETLLLAIFAVLMNKN